MLEPWGDGHGGVAMPDWSSASSLWWNLRSCSNLVGAVKAHGTIPAFTISRATKIDGLRGDGDQEDRWKGGTVRQRT